MSTAAGSTTRTGCDGVLALTGPSGGGKTTLLRRLMAEFPERFAFSVSHTTRRPRRGELDGHDYHFVDRTDMEDMVERGLFIEHAHFGDNIYGTSKDAVRQVQQTGRICILDIELQGIRNVKQTELKPLCILLKPPSLDVLERRLRDRRTDNEEAIQKRLKHAREDLAAVEAEQELFDSVVVNDDLEKAYSDFVDALQPLLAKQS